MSFFSSLVADVRGDRDCVDGLALVFADPHDQGAAHGRRPFSPAGGVSLGASARSQSDQTMLLPSACTYRASVLTVGLSCWPFSSLLKAAFSILARSAISLSERPSRSRSYGGSIRGVGARLLPGPPPLTPPPRRGGTHVGGLLGIGLVGPPSGGRVWALGQLAARPWSHPQVIRRRRPGRDFKSASFPVERIRGDRQQDDQPLDRLFPLGLAQPHNPAGRWCRGRPGPARSSPAGRRRSGCPPGCRGRRRPPRRPRPRRR